MGASKRDFTEQRENFYGRLEDDEEFANVSMKIYVLDRLKGLEKEKDYTINNIKQNDPNYKKDKTLRELEKQVRKRKQEISHNK